MQPKLASSDGRPFIGKVKFCFIGNAFKSAFARKDFFTLVDLLIITHTNEGTVFESWKMWLLNKATYEAEEKRFPSTL